MPMHRQNEGVAFECRSHGACNFISHLSPNDLLIFKDDLGAHQQGIKPPAQGLVYPVKWRSVGKRDEQNMGVDDNPKGQRFGSDMAYAYAYEPCDENPRRSSLFRQRPCWPVRLPALQRSRIPSDAIRPTSHRGPASLEAWRAAQPYPCSLFRVYGLPWLFFFSAWRIHTDASPFRPSEQKGSRMILPRCIDPTPIHGHLAEPAARIPPRLQYTNV